MQATTVHEDATTSWTKQKHNPTNNYSHIDRTTLVVKSRVQLTCTFMHVLFSSTFIARLLLWRDSSFLAPGMHCLDYFVRWFNWKSTLACTRRWRSRWCISMCKNGPPKNVHFYCVCKFENAYYKDRIYNGGVVVVNKNNWCSFFMKAYYLNSFIIGISTQLI